MAGSWRLDCCVLSYLSVALYMELTDMLAVTLSIRIATSNPVILMSEYMMY